MNCPMYGTVESRGPVCLVCGGCGDENPPRCPPAEEVEIAIEWRGWPPTRWEYTRKRAAKEDDNGN